MPVHGECRAPISRCATAKRSVPAEGRGYEARDELNVWRLRVRALMDIVDGVLADVDLSDRSSSPATRRLSTDAWRPLSCLLRALLVHAGLLA
jgi:hypothetical protein